jgi:hypothetical protein
MRWTTAISPGSASSPATDATSDQPTRRAAVRGPGRRCQPAFETSAELKDRIQAFQADGFQIGANADVNTAGATHYFVAWSAANPRVRTGLYLGDGLAGRAIEGVGFRPTAVMIKRLDSQPGVHRPASVTGDLTLPAPAAAAFTNARRPPTVSSWDPTRP